MQTFDNTRAILEGWEIKKVDQFFSEEFCLKRIDSSRQFLSDDDAWTHVINQAAFASDLYHISALQFIERNNPMEFRFIESTAATLGISGGLRQFFHLLEVKAA